MENLMRVEMAQRAMVAALIVGLSGGTLAGCNGCQGPAKPAVQSNAPTPSATATPAEVAKTAAPTAAGAGEDARAEAATAKAPDAGVYKGPSSESPDGYKVASGFADEQGRGLAQPAVLELGHAYITVLDPQNRPLGTLGKLAGADMHGFLVARDMRQALYSRAVGKITPESDARDLRFKPREGGDHALIVAFATSDDKTHTIATPIVVKGALPVYEGTGVAGLGDRARIEGGDLRLFTEPAQAMAGQPVTLVTEALDNTGKARAGTELSFVLVYNDQLGIGEVLPITRGRSTAWTPAEPGLYAVLGAPKAGSTALTWKIAVVPAAEKAEK